MSDTLTKKQRSYCMSKIRSKNTRPERVVRKVLRLVGIKYRLNSRLLGKPDIYIIGRKTLIFIDGCFWHRCEMHYNIPTKNADFWDNKIRLNVTRDRKYRNILKKRGYKIIRIWEHEVRNTNALIRKIERELKKT